MTYDAWKTTDPNDRFPDADYPQDETDEVGERIAEIDVKDARSWGAINALWFDFGDDPRVDRLVLAYESEHGPVNDPYDLWAEAETPFADNH